MSLSSKTTLWNCDGAKHRTGGCLRQNRTTGNVPRYRCDACDFDLCDLCWRDTFRRPVVEPLSPAAAAAACSSGGHFPDSMDEVRRLYAARSDVDVGGSAASHARDIENDDDEEEEHDEGEWMNVDEAAMVILAQLERLARPFGPTASSPSSSSSSPFESLSSSSSSASASVASSSAVDAPTVLQHPLSLDVGARTLAQLCAIVKLLVGSASPAASSASLSSSSSSLSSSVSVSSSGWSPVRTRALLAALRVLTAHIHAAARANMSAEEVGLGFGPGMGLEGSDGSQSVSSFRCAKNGRALSKRGGHGKDQEQGRGRELLILLHGIAAMGESASDTLSAHAFHQSVRF